MTCVVAEEVSFGRRPQRPLSQGPQGAVRHRQEQKYAAQDADAYDQQLAEQQAYAAPAAPDYAAELESLAQLKNQGILTEEEFEAKKKQILGL